MLHNCSIESVASAFPQQEFTQRQVGQLLGVENPVVQRLLDAPHIQTRRLMLDADPQRGEPMPRENLSKLDKRFHEGIATFGLEAARDAMAKAGVAPGDITTVVGVTSSGLALPGLSAILIRDLGVSRRAHRADLVGMGCNAGMSGLRTLCQMVAARGPAGGIGLLLCCEVSSALYVRDNTVGTGIVNSLFGDGAVAVVVRSPAPERPVLTPVVDNKSFASEIELVNARVPKLRMVDFESATFPELFDDMKYEVDEAHQMYKFLLSKRIPTSVAAAVSEPVSELLERAGVECADVKHWVVHSGGAAVIAGVTSNLGLADDALRHTTSVLRDFGNISSGSVLVSLERLLDEHVKADKEVIRRGDPAVMIGMGPGATIEVGLGYF